MHGPPIDTGRVHPDQYFVVGDDRSADPCRAQRLGWAVAVLHDRPHR
jgi:hypothetical protein